MKSTSLSLTKTMMMQLMRNSASMSVNRLLPKPRHSRLLNKWTLWLKRILRTMITAQVASEISTRLQLQRAKSQNLSKISSLSVTEIPKKRQRIKEMWLQLPIKNKMTMMMSILRMKPNSTRLMKKKRPRLKRSKSKQLLKRQSNRNLKQLLLQKMTMRMTMIKTRKTWTQWKSMKSKCSILLKPSSIILPSA